MLYLGLKRRDKEARLDEVKAASAAVKAGLGAVSYGLGSNTIHLRFFIFCCSNVSIVVYRSSSMLFTDLHTSRKLYDFCMALDIRSGHTALYSQISTSNRFKLVWMNAKRAETVCIL